jgi:hypothetical protein
MNPKFNTAIRYGLIAGGVIILYFLTFYLVQPRLLFNPFVYWASLGIYIAIVFRALQAEKSKAGESYDFRQALRTAFFIFVIANFLYYLFYYVLFAWIDPGLIDLQREVMEETLEARKSMLSPKQLEALEASMQDDAMAVTPGSVFFTYIRALIGNFLLALGLAYFINRQ